MQHTGKSSRAPQHLPQGQFEAGLSSTMNQNWMLKVFDHSTAEQISDVLKRAGYRPPAGAAQVTPQAVQAAMRAEQSRLLSTPQGQKQLAQVRNDALNREVNVWIISEEGQSEIARQRAELLAAQVCKDGDVFAKACREEIQRQVTRWLKSPAGIEVFEQEKKRKINAMVKQLDTPGNSAATWVHETLKELKTDG